MLVAVLVFGFSGVVNAYTMASTNDENRTNNWAHVNILNQETDSVEVEFVSTRNFWSCFEYRSDGDTSQKTDENNYNPIVDDGLYPYTCINNETKTMVMPANEYVEVRMVFGGESDERFDWTRFDVLFERTAEITSPTDGEVVTGLVSFDAILNDKDGDDNVQWAVRKGTCAANTNTVAGNVDGFSNTSDWDGFNFHAESDVTSWEDGEYCFIFNPTESTGDVAIRETREFVVSNPPTEINQCKKGGWENFVNPTFKNQGDCVSWLQSNENAKGNRKDN